NNNITMIIFLPNKNMEPGNLEYLDKKLNFAEFKSIRNAYTNKFEQDMELYLPKFTSQCRQNMTEYFHQMGIITMFEDNADFTRLSKIPLKVNNIVQTISVTINEESLEVPNVDRNEVRKLASPLQELVVDRPFHYIIEIHGEIIFVGTVRVPDFRTFMRDKL
ncbi:protein Z-dependent protease inhibitor-like, partial [Formica exsecta]|uniref:protein Z-dependent protease inhibitor-like n=1 Tax=Formica exsecta TaxID=72781 RepID=UPI0011446866